MKSPKRDYKQDVCPKCGSVVHWYREEVDNGTGYETVDAYGECCNEDCDFSVKGLRDHDGWEDHQQEARWKRKNREARVRHKIDLLSSQLFLCSWFIERHMSLSRKFAEFVKETPVECRQGDRLISTTYFTVTRTDIEGS